MCSLASSVSLARNPPRQQCSLWGSNRQQKKETSAFGSNEALGRCLHAFKCFFFLLLLICSLAQSSLPPFPSPCRSVSSPHHLSPISSYFKIPSSHWFFFFLPPLSSLFLWDFFFSPACESPFCSTVATQKGSAVWAEALGETLCQTERKKKKGWGGGGGGITARLLIRQSCISPLSNQPRSESIVNLIFVKKH